MAEKLFLIDGTAIIYRAFFAFIRNPLINSKGQHTSAIFGSANTMIKMIEKYNIKNIFICSHLLTDTISKEECNLSLET